MPGETTERPAPAAEALAGAPSQAAQPAAPAAPAPGAEAAAPEHRPGLLGKFRPLVLILFAVLLLLAAALLAFLVMRILRARPRPAWVRALSQAVREGHPLIEMIVTTQNRHIGYRNVHYVRPGSSASVGGGRSTFLIYFVKVPPRMAYLRNDDGRYIFVPVKTDLFPDLAGPVRDCLGREIPAQSPRGYRFTIVFRRYISTLDEINRLLRSVRPRGPAKPPSA
jgi:hypothetical protein